MPCGPLLSPVLVDFAPYWRKSVSHHHFFVLLFCPIPSNNKLWHVRDSSVSLELAKGSILLLNYSRRHYLRFLFILGVSLKDGVCTCLYNYCLWDASFIKVHFTILRMPLRISSNFFSSHLRVIASDLLPLLTTSNHARGVASIAGGSAEWRVCSTASGCMSCESGFNI